MSRPKKPNGLQAGDAGYRGFLKITFRNEASTDLAVSGDGHPEIQRVQSLTLTFRGDAEFDLATQAFEMAPLKYHLRWSSEGTHG